MSQKRTQRRGVVVASEEAEAVALLHAVALFQPQQQNDGTATAAAWQQVALAIKAELGAPGTRWHRDGYTARRARDQYEQLVAQYRQAPALPRNAMLRELLETIVADDDATGTKAGTKDEENEEKEEDTAIAVGTKDEEKEEEEKAVLGTKDEDKEEEKAITVSETIETNDTRASERAASQVVDLTEEDARATNEEAKSDASPPDCLRTHPPTHAERLVAPIFASPSAPLLHRRSATTAARAAFASSPVSLSLPATPALVMARGPSVRKRIWDTRMDATRRMSRRVARRGEADGHRHVSPNEEALDDEAMRGPVGNDSQEPEEADHSMDALDDEVHDQDPSVGAVTEALGATHASVPTASVDVAEVAGLPVALHEAVGNVSDPVMASPQEPEQSNLDDSLDTLTLSQGSLEPSQEDLDVSMSEPATSSQSEPDTIEMAEVTSTTTTPLQTSPEIVRPTVSVTVRQDQDLQQPHGPLSDQRTAWGDVGQPSSPDTMQRASCIAEEREDPMREVTTMLYAMQSAQAVFQQQVGELSAAVVSSEQARAELRSELVALRDAHEGTRKENAALRDTVERLTQETPPREATPTDAFEKLEQSMHVLSANSVVRDADLVQLQDTVACLKKKLEDTHHEYTRLEEHVLSLFRRTDKLKAAVQPLQDHEKLRAESNADLEKEELRQQHVADAVREAYTKWTNDQQQARDELAETLCRESERAVREAEARVMLQLNLRETEHVRFRQDLLALAERTKTLEATMSVHGSTLQDHKAKLDTSRKKTIELGHEFEIARQQFSRLQDDVDAHRTAITKMHECLDSVRNKVTTWMEDAQKTRIALQEATEADREMLKKWEQYMQEEKQSGSEDVVASLRSELIEAARELEIRLKNELEHQKSAMIDLKQEMLALPDRMKTLEDAMKVEHEEFRESHNAKLEDWSSKLKGLEHSASLVNETVQQLQEQVVVEAASRVALQEAVECDRRAHAEWIANEDRTREDLGRKMRFECGEAVDQMTVHLKQVLEQTEMKMKRELDAYQSALQTMRADETLREKLEASIAEARRRDQTLATIQTTIEHDRRTAMNQHMSVLRTLKAILEDS